MTQPAPSPFHLSNLLVPALEGIVHALSDRGGQTEARREARAAATQTLILSFLPRDVIDLTLAGQLIAFNELFADGTRDVLRGMVDTMKQRTQSSLVAMGRLTQGHLDRLEKRGNQPFRTEVAALQQDKREAPAADPPGAEVVHQRPPLAAAPAASSAPAPPPAPAVPQPPDPPAPDPRDPPAEPLVLENSWLDEPCQEWLLETPASLAAQPEADPAMETATPANAADPDTGIDGAWTGPPPDPDFQDPDFRYQETGNSLAPVLAEATAGD